MYEICMCIFGHEMVTHKILGNFCVAYIKKTRKCFVKSYFEALKIVFFTRSTKNVILSRNFVRGHRMSGRASWQFLLNYTL
jgi:hypothetical protein